MVGFSIGYVIALIVWYILLVVAQWKIFTKAGEKGWKSIIPIWNIFVLFRIAWGRGIIFLLLLIPIVNIVIEIMTLHKLSKAYGHGIGFTIGLIFLGPIFLLILGFENSQYLGPQ